MSSIKFTNVKYVIGGGKKPFRDSCGKYKIGDTLK